MDEKTIKRIGRLYGTHEADRRGEKGKKREERIKRAEAYAVWRFRELDSRITKQKKKK